MEGATDEFRSVISPVAIASNNWVAAEDVVHGIIHKVRPTSESEEKRREVVGYIQRLIGNCLGVEVDILSTTVSYHFRCLLSSFEHLQI